MVYVCFGLEGDGPPKKACISAGYPIACPTHEHKKGCGWKAGTHRFDQGTGKWYSVEATNESR